MRTLWLVRHGNRQDFVDPSWQATAARPHDPPLSPDGVAQAHETGAFLAGEAIDHLFASPFLRTVETAAAIADHIGLPIRLEHGLCELLRGDWFPTFPDCLPVDTLAARFPRIDAAYRSVNTPTYPETEETHWPRTAETITRLLHQYPGNLLLVSHGAPIIGIARALIPDSPSLHTTFCCLIKLVERNGIWTLEADGRDTSHLSQEAGELRFR